MKKNNKKGFTLAELLIVVAIIAVLVAIAIPVFTTQLAKSQMATDLANVRAAYAEKVATAMADGSFDANGKIAVTISDPCKYCTVSKTASKVIVKHSKRTSIQGSFGIDSDVTLTIN